MQVKEVMKNLKTMANEKSKAAKKGKSRLDEKRDAQQDNGPGSMNVVPPKREPENYISNETREFIQNSMNKNKMKSAGFIHPAQLEKLIFLEQ